MLTEFLLAHGPKLKLALALSSAALLSWGYWLQRRGMAERASRLRDGLLALFAALACVAYFNWGVFHYWSRIHYHDFFHYYVGAKYFPELGYTRLYECASLADAESGHAEEVAIRKIRDLRANELVPARYVLDQPALCKDGFSRPFTSERWRAFKSDIAFFRSTAQQQHWNWERFLKDHGYNATPVWNIAGSLLANIRPASYEHIEWILASLDPALLIMTLGFVTWGFGWRAAAIAAIFLGTNALSQYSWTGGAYLRQDWIMFSLTGLCLLKRGKLGLAGASLGTAALLRIFPVAFLVPILLRLAWILVRERRVAADGARILAGAMLSAAVLVPASAAVAGTPYAWTEFVANTQKHVTTPLTNYMGLRTIVGFRWDMRERYTVDMSSDDPWHGFKEARKQAMSGRLGQPLFLALVAAYLAVLAWSLRRESEWWVFAAFGFALVPIGMELTCYYYSFLTAAALFWDRRPPIAIGLLLLAGTTQFVLLQTHYFDVRYYCESILVVGFVIWATCLYGLDRRARPALLTSSHPGGKTIAG